MKDNKRVLIIELEIARFLLENPSCEGASNKAILTVESLEMAIDECLIMELRLL